MLKIYNEMHFALSRIVKLNYNFVFVFVFVFFLYKSVSKGVQITGARSYIFTSPGIYVKRVHTW